MTIKSTTRKRVEIKEVDKPLALPNLNGCIGIGVAQICYTIDIPDEKATVTLEIESVVVASATLDAAHQSVVLNGDIGLAYANATVIVDFSNNQVTSSGHACVRNPLTDDQCTDWKNVIVVQW